MAYVYGMNGSPRTVATRAARLSLRSLHALNLDTCSCAAYYHSITVYGQTDIRDAPVC